MPAIAVNLRSKTKTVKWLWDKDMPIRITAWECAQGLFIMGHLNNTKGLYVLGKRDVFGYGGM